MSDSNSDSKPTLSPSQIISSDSLNRHQDIKYYLENHIQTYLIDKIFPTGKLHLIGGPSGSGKSTWLLQTIYDWQSSKDILGYKSFPSSNYLYLSCDRGFDEVVSVMERLGLENWGMKFLSIEEVQKRANIDYTKLELKDLPTLFPDTKIFFIEAINWFNTCGVNQKQINHNAYQDSLRYWTEVRAVFEEKGCTIIGTTHSPKAKGKDKYVFARDRLMGSAAQAAIASTIIQFDIPEPEDNKESVDTSKVRRLTLLPRNAANQIFHYNLGDKGELIFDRVITTQSSTKKDTSLNADIILSANLCACDVGTIVFTESVEAWAENAGFARVTAHRFIAFMKEKGVLRNMTKRGRFILVKKPEDTRELVAKDAKGNLIQ